MDRRALLKGAAAGVAAAGARSLITRPAAAAGPGGVTSVVNVVAHADDDLLFLSPDLLAHVQAGRYVRTVFVTAGDAGLGSSYWLDREAGSRAAYDVMIGGSGWTTATLGLSTGAPVLFTSRANPRVSHVHLRLPDGHNDGSGHPSTGNTSLQGLWQGSSGSLNAVDGSVAYSRAELIDTLADIFSVSGADIVNTQDFGGGFGDGDHSDHHAVARFAAAAHARYAAEHQFAGYLGYVTASMPANLDGPALDTKRRAFFAYIDYDTMACGSPAACGTGQYGAWLGRQYRIDGEPPLIDNPPVATITAPGASLRWTAGQTIAFAGRAVDGEDGNLGASRLRWRVELVQPGAGPDGEDLAGPGQSYNGVASGTFVVPAWDRSPQQLRIELTATDSAANSTVEELRLDPAPPPTTTTTTTRPPTTTTTTRPPTTTTTTGPPTTTTTTTRPTTVVPPPANAAAPPLNPYARAFFEGIQRDREQRFWQAVARWVQYLRRSRLRRR